MRVDTYSLLFCLLVDMCLFVCVCVHRPLARPERRTMSLYWTCLQGFALMCRRYHRSNKASDPCERSCTRTIRLQKFMSAHVGRLSAPHVLDPSNRITIYLNNYFCFWLTIQTLAFHWCSHYFGPLRMHHLFWILINCVMW